MTASFPSSLVCGWDFVLRLRRTVVAYLKGESGYAYANKFRVRGLCRCHEMWVRSGGTHGAIEVLQAVVCVPVHQCGRIAFRLAPSPSFACACVT